MRAKERAARAYARKYKTAPSEREALYQFLVKRGVIWNSDAGEWERPGGALVGIRLDAASKEEAELVIAAIKRGGLRTAGRVSVRVRDDGRVHVYVSVGARAKNRKRTRQANSQARSQSGQFIRAGTGRETDAFMRRRWP